MKYKITKIIPIITQVWIDILFETDILKKGTRKEFREKVIETHTSQTKAIQSKKTIGKIIL